MKGLKSFIALLRSAKSSDIELFNKFIINFQGYNISREYCKICKYYLLLQKCQVALAPLNTKFCIAISYETKTY